MPSGYDRGPARLPATVVAGRRQRLAKVTLELDGARQILSAQEAQVRLRVDQRTAAQSAAGRAAERLEWSDFDRLREEHVRAIGAAEAAIAARDAVARDVIRRERLVEAAQKRYDEVRVLDRSLFVDRSDPVSIALEARS